MLISPQLQYFTASEYDELVEYLQSLDSDTLREPIHAADDVHVCDEWTTGDGYRFTQLALKQLCAATSSGLYTTVQDIAGWRPTADETLRTSYTAAAQILNMCTTLRMSGSTGLRNYMRVCDARNSTIDGIIRRGRNVADNYQLVATAHDIFTCRDYVFAGAYTLGRWVTLAFRQTSRLCYLTDAACPLYAGWHITNSEVGELPARVAQAYILSDEVGGGVCRDAGEIIPYKEGAYVELLTRKADVVSHVFTSTDEVAARIKQLRGQTITLSDRTPMIVDCARAGIAYNIATTLVGQLFGRYKCRTLWEVVLRGMFMAREQHPKLQQPLEWWLYRLFTRGEGKVDGEEETCTGPS